MGVGQSAANLILNFSVLNCVVCNVMIFESENDERKGLRRSYKSNDRIFYVLAAFFLIHLFLFSHQSYFFGRISITRFWILCMRFKVPLSDTSSSLCFTCVFYKKKIIFPIRFAERSLKLDGNFRFFIPCCKSHVWFFWSR